MTTHYPPKSFNEYETKVKKWANHIIIFLLGLFVGISMYLLELPVPLQGTIYKISEAPQKHEKSVLTSKTKGSYVIKVACFVSPQLIKYIDQKQEVSSHAISLGRIQKNKNFGFVSAIQKEAIENPNQIRYRIDCELSDTDIILSNGYKAHLLEGMKVQGHLYLYRRKIIEFILDQIDQWLCPASLRGT
jgi:hypothetical protein